MVAGTTATAEAGAATTVAGTMAGKEPARRDFPLFLLKFPNLKLFNELFLCGLCFLYKI